MVGEKKRSFVVSDVVIDVVRGCGVGKEGGRRRCRRGGNKLTRVYDP